MTRVGLSQRSLLNWGSNLSCVQCGFTKENIDHLFSRCVVGSSLLSRFVDLMGLTRVCCNLLIDILESWQNKLLRVRWNVARIDICAAILVITKGKKFEDL